MIFPARSGIALGFAILATTVHTSAVNKTGCSYPLLYHANYEDLTGGLESGCFTSVDLVTAYLARMEEVAGLQAMMETAPEAFEFAAQLDAERANGTIRGPLHGLPILVKDNIATYDMNNTAGSYALLGAKTSRDSTVIAKLRSAGAIILGKTNMSQWAQHRSKVNGTNGWSAVGGQVYGGFYEHQDPYGSSSGSAVGAGLGLTFAAIGTETHGSIVQPSNRGNIVGIKPSMGLTSRFLVIPETLHQDTVGPLARSVRDAAILLSVMAGVDSNDNYTLAIPNGGMVPDYVAAATNVTDLTGVRIGIPRNAITTDVVFAPINESYIMSEFDKAIDVLKSLGAVIVDNTNFSTEAQTALASVEYEATTISTDFKANLETYFSELTYNPNNIHSLADLRNYTVSDPREDFPDRDIGYFDDALELNFTAGSADAYAALQTDLNFDATGGITGTINKYNLSALIIPTEFAPTYAASPGLPEISVPLGAYPDGTPIINGSRELIAVAPGIPFGMTFYGKKWSEETLIKLAYSFEQATHYRDSIIPGEKGTMPTTEIIDVLKNKTSSSNTNSTSTVSTQSNGAGAKTPLALMIVTLTILLWNFA